MVTATPPTLYGRPVARKYQRQAARALRRYTRKYGHDPAAHYPLGSEEHGVLGPALGVRTVVSDADAAPLDPASGIVVGTIRMGYGHYRIAMAIASAARAMGLTPYWFDLLGFESTGARLIQDLDYWYSRLSRLSQRSRLFNRSVWEPLTANAYKRLEKNYPIIEMCRLLANVYADFPADTPFTGAHPWLAIAARHAGLERVVNIVPDNCPLGFHLAPGALHAVQSPSAHTIFRTLQGIAPPGATGVPANEVAVAGHFIDHELVVNIERDCRARLTRIASGAPRRVLISIGGAGAQQDLLIQVVRRLMPRVQRNETALLLNFGDHARARAAFDAALPGLAALAVHHDDWSGTTTFAESILDGPLTGVHTFLHHDTAAAVYATNLLMRGADVLLTKPSELAFYPVPKLMLPRVGGHEAWGAIRAAELGDGTPECVEPSSVIPVLNGMLQDGDILANACTHIQRQHAIGTYNGAYRAVEWARAGKITPAQEAPRQEGQSG